MKRAWGTPPELRDASAAEHYADKEAARYTNTGARIGIQQDMSRRAIDLMMHGGWGGGEETEEVARQLPGCRGRLTLVDVAQALPLRAASLDGAISISALQWLCVPVRAEDLTLGLFEGLARALKPRARAVLQVYMRGERDVDLFVWAALRARLRAAYMVDYSHASDAKKYYFVVEKSERGGGKAEAADDWK
ncbi:hypothetical protein H632_c2965p0, partial [Helicosporidium sp. ATCC 50920]